LDAEVRDRLDVRKMTYRKKLIEVALPLEEINVASAREKSIRHGHPSTLHLWWARRPLATCRAVLFASIIDDPGEEGAPEALLTAIDELPLAQKYRHLADEEPVDDEGNELPAELADREKVVRKRRYRLFTFIERLVQWENSNDEMTLRTARDLILAATDGNPPPVMDPFCGGGTIPLEAQRLGLEAHASDLNPVAVLITKAMIELPPKFTSQPPVNPEAKKNGLGAWTGAQGLAEDVRFYSRWMRDEAERCIGHLYPKYRVAPNLAQDRPDLNSYVDQDLTVIAWLWGRTAKCPNPACGADVPLVRSFALSTKKGSEAWVETVPKRNQVLGVDFAVRVGQPDETERRVIEAGTCVVVDRDVSGQPLKKLKKIKATFLCPTCKQGVLKGDAIDDQANSVGLGIQPLAVVAEGKRGRLYLPFDAAQEMAFVNVAEAFAGLPEGSLPTEACRGTFASNAQGRIYGFKQFKDYFTNRQLVALATFNNLVKHAQERVLSDARAAGLSTDQAAAYADAVTTYLGLSVSKLTDIASTVCSWHSGAAHQKIRATFSRQAIPMTWDFAEGNPFSTSSGNYLKQAALISEVLDHSVPAAVQSGFGEQADATRLIQPSAIRTSDPPYFDNIGYADLSDFFYVWLRRSLGDVYPNLFSTMLTPKHAELIATPHRHEGSREKATEFFEHGLHEAFARMRENALSEFPTTIYYAFKQAETEGDEETGGTETASTGWESMLQGLLDAGFLVNGTWPTRTELANRMIASGTNALASCIVLVCRPREANAPKATRREFLGALRQELRPAIVKLTQGNVAPVDLAQAAIGPGMAVFSRYAAVLEADGKPMRVRTALALINQSLDEALGGQEGWYDPETRWAVTWFGQRGFTEGPYGEATLLATAKDTAVEAMRDAGILRSGGGKVKLLSREELPSDYDPATDRRVAIWETTQYLARALDKEGEAGAARMMRRFRDSQPQLDVDRARELAYRLYAICDSKRQAQEARIYNALVLSWTDIDTVSQSETATWQASDKEANLFS
jgi:putative DNA methylase